MTAGDLAAGMQVGDCRLVERLGRGPFSETWRATDGDGRAVAVKVATDPRYAELLVERGPDLGAGSHASLVATLRIVTDVDPPHVVSEYVPGASLEYHLVENEPFGRRGAVRILTGILEGLAHLEARGCRHGALTSRNVLLADDGRALLTDVEVGAQTRALTDEILAESEHAVAPAVAGLLPYIDFEDLRIPGGRNRRADLFGAGAVFYEMLTGQPPDLEAGEPWSAGPVPTSLSGVLRRLLAPLDQRFDSAADALEELEEIGDDEEDRADEEAEGGGGDPAPRPASPAVRPPSFDRRDSAIYVIRRGERTAETEGKMKSHTVRLRRVSEGLWEEVEEGEPAKPELAIEAEDDTSPLIERKLLRYEGTGSRKVRRETARGYVRARSSGAVFLPVGLVREAGWCFLLLAGLFLTVTLVPGLRDPGGGEVVDPTGPPPAVKPEWFFLPLYQLSNVAPSVGGFDREGMTVLLVLLGGLLLVGLPFWDRSRTRPGDGRWIFHPLVFLIAAQLLGWAYWGSVHPARPLTMNPAQFLGIVAALGLGAGLAWEYATGRGRSS